MNGATLGASIITDRAKKMHCRACTAVHEYLSGYLTNDGFKKTVARDDSDFNRSLVPAASPTATAAVAAASATAAARFARTGFVHG